MSDKSNSNVVLLAEELVELCESSVAKCKKCPQLFNDEDLELQHRELELSRKLLKQVKDL